MDDRTSTSVDDSSTSTSADDNMRTSISLVDTSSTSTTLDSTTSTSIDDRSTSSTNSSIDATVSITMESKSYDVDGAGSVSIQVVAGQLVLLDAEAASGWALEVDEADARDIKVEFESGDSDARFEAKIRDGELRVEIERD